MREIELDVHTHTIVSGHAYGTLTEMVKAAAEKGLKLFGITEHAKGIPGTCEDIYFHNMRVVPREMEGLRLLLGSEINILDYEGTLSLGERYIRCLDLRIAGIHSLCYEFGTKAQNTRAVVKAMENPAVDIISHPDDGKCPLDYEEVVLASKENHTLLEVNNNGLRHPESHLHAGENVREYLTLCKKYQVPVILGSDAHYMNDIANYDAIWPALADTDFPPQLIMNYSAEGFLKFLRQNREREKG